METSPNIDIQKPIQRDDLLVLVRTALRIKSYRFARQTVLAWLSTFPGDLLVNFYLAQALIGEGRVQQASAVLDELSIKDPEFAPVWQALASPKVTPDGEKRLFARSCLAALGENVSDRVSIPEWAALLKRARTAISENRLDDAETLVETSLMINPDTPLPAILHTWINVKQEDLDVVETKAKIYHQRWPDCLHFALFLAEARLQAGDESGSVALLHQCAALDTAGQVPARIWNADFPYKPLWPDRLQILFSLPIPGAVAAELGWNVLPEKGCPSDDEEITPLADPIVEFSAEQLAKAGHAGSNRHREEPKIFPNIRIGTNLNLSDTLRAIQTEFERLARRFRRPEAGTGDGRFPIYLILSTKTGLEKQYGPHTSSVIQEEMKKLAETIRRRPNWGAMVYFPDDPTCTAAYNLKPAPANDAWKLKLAIADLDTALVKKGQMVGTVLIVGGPQVVPFHRLPNPTDDSDAEISSDNPYATKDENYFIPEWPIGRLPGGIGSDAGGLLTSLRKIIAYHTRNTRPDPWWRNTPLLTQTAKLVKTIFSAPHSPYRMKPAFGYTAAIWKQSSVAVYKSIGETNTMLVSPPAGTGSVHKSGLLPANLTYFNLHGLPDTAEWYGQKDLDSDQDDPDYPVALSIKDISTNGQAPRLVFSEACYGAHIDDKEESKSLALHFLANGTLAMVGSTCISYGSVSTPLIGADLFGQVFWKQIHTGQTVGEAFLQAKISLVQEMNQRQGYLDGEDQKTLISFVLYGDPLVTLNEKGSKQKSLIRPREYPTVKTINDHSAQEIETEKVSIDLVAQTKKIVQQYLPAYQDAEIQYSQYNPSTLIATNPYADSSVVTKVKKSMVGRQTKIVLNKSVKVARHNHQHYARITLDDHGRMVKLVVSR